MRYVNVLLTYLLTYLLTSPHSFVAQNTFLNEHTELPGRKRSQLCKRAAVYPAFAQQVTLQGNSMLKTLHD